MNPKSLLLAILAMGMLIGAAYLRSQSPVPAERYQPVVNSLTELRSASEIAPSGSPSPPRLPSPEAAWRRQVRQALMQQAAPTTKASTNPGRASGSPQMSASPTAPGASPAVTLTGATPTPIMRIDRKSSPSPAAPMDVKKLHAQAIVVDTHVETPLLISERGVQLARNPRGQVDLEKLRKGGVDVVFFSIFVNPLRYAKIAKPRADQIIKMLKQQVAVHSKQIEMAYTYNDIQRIVAQGKIAGLMGMEGGDPIGTSVQNVDYFYKQGVRYLSPTWSTHTLLGDSASPKKPRWKGLSKLGKQVVQRMNQLGMLIDVSHVSDATFNDVLKLSRQPVIASHSGMRSVRAHPRNLSPDMLKRLAKQGGTVGIYFYPPYIDKRPVSDLKKVVDHIDAAVKLVGAQHVGLGSDFDGLDSRPPRGLEDASKFPGLSAELRQRKYSDADIEMILGGSFMRVFAQVLR